MTTQRRVAVFILIILAVGCAYGLMFWNSLRKIDAFCDSVSTSTKMDELQEIAERAGVDLRGPMEMSGSSGTYTYAVAASGFTIGEYSCRIRGTSASGTASSKQLGY